MAKGADKKAMLGLHGAVAEVLTKVVEEGVTEVTKDGEVITVPASAALLAVAVKFLKDNGIDHTLTPEAPDHNVAADYVPFTNVENEDDPHTDHLQH